MKARRRWEGVWRVRTVFRIGDIGGDLQVGGQWAGERAEGGGGGLGNCRRQKGEQLVLAARLSPGRSPSRPTSSSPPQPSSSPQTTVTTTRACSGC